MTKLWSRLLARVSKEERLELKGFYRDWSHFNLGPFFSTLAPFMASIMVSVAALNLVLRGGLYRESIFGSALFFATGLFITLLFLLHWRLSDRSPGVSRACIILSFMAYTSATLFTNLIAMPTSEAYSFSIVFTVVVSIWVLYQFWIEWLLYILFASLAALILALVNPAMTPLIIFTELMIYIMMLLTFLIRRRYFLEIYQRFIALRALMPTRVARHITISGERSLKEVFEPRHTFVVCLSSDWRGFQRLASTLAPKDLAALLETYYHQVFRKLAETVPEETYYADWTADELFVIFYGHTAPDEASPARIIQGALDFAHRLATEIPSEVERIVGRRLVFDIGMAAGVGLLGLLGPPERMKTTLVAEVAGVAARLQAEGKRLRRDDQTAFAQPVPLLVMDAAVHERALMDARFPGMQPFLAEEKDVAGRQFHVWSQAIAGGRGVG